MVWVNSINHLILCVCLAGWIGRQAPVGQLFGGPTWQEDTACISHCTIPEGSPWCTPAAFDQFKFHFPASICNFLRQEESPVGFYCLGEGKELPFEVSCSLAIPKAECVPGSPQQKFLKLLQQKGPQFRAQTLAAWKPCP